MLHRLDGPLLRAMTLLLLTPLSSTLDATAFQCSGPDMGRLLPKLIVLIAIGLVVAAIFVVTRGGPSTEPNVVYVNPGFATTAPAPPAP